MITIINQTDIPFTTVLGDKLNQKDNRRVSVNYGRMRIDAFIEATQVDDFMNRVNGLVQNGDLPALEKYEAKTRLYFSNKEYQPIIVEAKSTNANFLILAHKLESTERVIRVEYDGVFAVTRGFEKGKYIATTASFRNDRESYIRFITVNGDKVTTTTYTSTAEGLITVAVVDTPAAQYKKYPLTDRGSIKPYRPHRATHLVFTTTEHADTVVKGNHAFVNFQDEQRLDEKINHFKEIGFTAASLYVDHDRADQPKSKQDIDALKKLQENFRIVYCVFADGFARDCSLAKKAPERKKQSRPQGQKQTPKRNPGNNKPGNNKPGKHRNTNKKKPAASKNK